MTVVEESVTKTTKTETIVESVTGNKVFVTNVGHVSYPKVKPHNQEHLLVANCSNHVGRKHRLLHVSRC